MTLKTNGWTPGSLTPFSKPQEAQTIARQPQPQVQMPGPLKSQGLNAARPRLGQVPSALTPGGGHGPFGPTSSKLAGGLGPIGSHQQLPEPLPRYSQGVPDKHTSLSALGSTPQTAPPPYSAHQEQKSYMPYRPGARLPDSPRQYQPYRPNGSAQAHASTSSDAQQPAYAPRPYRPVASPSQPHQPPRAAQPPPYSPSPYAPAIQPPKLGPPPGDSPLASAPQTLRPPAARPQTPASSAGATGAHQTATPSKPTTPDGHSFQVISHATGATASVASFEALQGNSKPSRFSQAGNATRPSGLFGSGKPPGPATPVTVASMDLTAGLKLNNLPPDALLYPKGHPKAGMPLMEASIVFEDPTGNATKPGSKEEMVVQRMQYKAYEALQQASGEIKDAIQSFDKALQGRTPSQQEVAMFKSTCQQIVQAQQAKVNQIVQNEWAMEQHRDSALAKSNMKFAAKMTFNAAKLTASATTMAAGTVTGVGLGVGAAAAAYNLYNTTQLIKSFAMDREAAIKKIEKHDQILNAEHNNQGKLSTGAVVGSELVSATHVPFSAKLTGPTVHRQELALEEFAAKSARLDKALRKNYAEMTKMQDELEKACRDAGIPQPQEHPNTGNPALDKKHRELFALRKEVNEMTNQVFDAMGKVAHDNEFYMDHKKRCNSYRNNQPVGLKPACEAVEMGSFALQLARFGKNIHTVATNAPMI